MDPLSQMVALLEPKALNWQVVEVDQSWGLRFPAFDAVKFGQVIEGSCEVELAGGQRFALEEGDFILVASTEPWLMRTPASIRLADFKDVLGDLSLVRAEPGRPMVRFFAGSFLFQAPNAELVSTLMPPAILIHRGEVANLRIGGLMRSLSEEVTEDRPGRSLIVDRLLEILLVEALRHDPAGLAAGPGLIAGLKVPKIADALRALHGETQRPWTVGSLARHVGMSRSAFATRFAETVGAPPMEYLFNWRMGLAKAALAEGRLPMSDIAEMAGYQSVSAFSTAFRRAAGVPPTRFGKTIPQPFDPMELDD